MILPRTDLNVSRIGLGTVDLGTRLDEDASFRLLDAYVEMGGNFLDTAHCYAFWKPDGLGASERIVGDYIRRRGVTSMVVATKGGHSDGGPDYPRPDQFLTPELIQRDFVESFERLGVGPIDMYYLHRDDPRVPVDEVMDMLDGLAMAGWVRAIGASNWSVARVAEANAWARKRTPFVAIQNQWSLVSPNWTDDGPGAMRFHTPSDVPALAELDVAVIPYSSTANGYFAGDAPKPGPFATPENAVLWDRVRWVAAQNGVTPTQVALGWLLAQPLPVVPLVGTCSVEHLREAMAAKPLDPAIYDTLFAY
jgi:aryl-alcohol dehydrogenase-like predicted oxidoreductase